MQESDSNSAAPRVESAAAVAARRFRIEMNKMPTARFIV
jgi:hypothetical protein